ncbi:hypothetical protein NPIL_548921 [Nephila pilipes]|uniref:Uncharacterized protein n=1 Tax=Nephila pilipes TaxID=299642 RepID=A0A8X6PHX0_NEPPI|nr:hypothetical protein NPIL_548921 [Nephila pilipes]
MEDGRIIIVMGKESYDEEKQVTAKDINQAFSMINVSKINETFMQTSGGVKRRDLPISDFNLNEKEFPRRLQKVLNDFK